MILESASDISTPDGRRPRLDEISNCPFVVAFLMIQVTPQLNPLSCD